AGADGHRAHVRAAESAPEPVLRAGRGGLGPGRGQPGALSGAAAGGRARFPVYRHHPPRDDDGGGRHAVRRDVGPGRRVHRRVPEPAGSGGEHQLDQEGDDDVVKQGGWLQRLREGLSRTRTGLKERVDELLGGRGGRIDVSGYEGWGEARIVAGSGVAATMRIIVGLRKRDKEEKAADEEAVKRLLREESAARLRRVACQLATGRRSAAISSR